MTEVSPFAEIRDEFLRFLAVEKGLSSNTLAAYGRDIEKFLGFLNRVKTTWAKARETDLVNFIHGESRSGLSARSLARLISVLKAFYHFLLLDGRLDRNPTVHLTSPKTWLALPKYLSETEVKTLLEQPAVSDSRGLRDRAMLEVMYASGLRVSELIGLRLPDIPLQGRIRPVSRQGREGADRAPGKVGRRGRHQVSRPGARRLRRRPRRSVVPHPARRSVHPAGILEITEGVREEGRSRDERPSPRPAAFLRHAPSRTRGGSPVRPDDARA
jgi:site-specific recombinase XerC